MQLDELLTMLPERHQLALRWFQRNAGAEVSWPAPIQLPGGQILLASKAKGIYKPSWSTYALSVRQSLGGLYPDREPVLRPDGSWLYSYFQENEDPTRRDEEFTNRGLLACLRAKVPVGVLRQTSGKPASRYKILGLALVTGWEDGYFFLEGISPTGLIPAQGPHGQVALLLDNQQRRSTEEGAFDPSGVLDARERTFAQIVRRRGQPEFRRRLLDAYRGKCCFSGCDALDALEAAHITPYLGPETNHLANGLLLRADLHTLFDVGLLAVDPDSLSILLALTLRNTVYAELEGRVVQIPQEPNSRPSIDALRTHRAWAGI